VSILSAVAVASGAAARTNPARLPQTLFRVECAQVVRGDAPERGGERALVDRGRSRVVREGGIGPPRHSEGFAGPRTPRTGPVERALGELRVAQELAAGPDDARGLEAGGRGERDLLLLGLDRAREARREAHEIPEDLRRRAVQVDLAGDVAALEVPEEARSSFGSRNAGSNGLSTRTSSSES
jgi:hypothetical protein